MYRRMYEYRYRYYLQVLVLNLIVKKTKFSKVEHAQNNANSYLDFGWWTFLAEKRTFEVEIAPSLRMLAACDKACPQAY